MSSYDLMTHTATIQRVTQTNVDGVILPTWNDLATIPCLVQENSGKLQLNAAGQGLVYDAVAYIPAGTDIKPQGLHDINDRVVMVTPTRLAGVTYLVKIVVDESGAEDHLVAYLMRYPAP
jgi:hypothetical protein